MALPTYYNLGTAAVANGSATVTITGANLTAWVQPGDIFYGSDGGSPVPIGSVDSDSQLTLMWGWGGTGLAAAAYSIQYSADSTRIVEKSRAAIEQLKLPVTGVPMVFAGVSATEADPGTGKLTFDSGTAPTIMRVSKTASGGYGSIAGLLAGLDDVTNAVARSVVSLRPTDGATAAPTLGVTGAVVDHGTYVTVPVVASDFALPATGAKLALSAVPSGNDASLGNPKGAYAAGTTYTLRDIVTNQNASWIYVNATPGAGHAPPTLPTTSNAYWQYLSGKGDKGDTGDPGLIGDWKGPWATGTVYAVDDAVQQGGSSYVAVTAHTSGTFATDLAAGKWQLVAAKGDVGPAATEGDPIVILATGQSNFTVRRTYSWTPPENLSIWNWDGTDGDVGTAFAAPDATTIGAADGFAAQIARRNPDRPVYLINISISGRPIAQWMTGASAPDMFANIVANVPPALAVLGLDKIDAMIWWQGEADADAPNPNYAANFETVMGRFTAETWFPLASPVLIFGIASTAITGVAAYDVINNHLQAAASKSPDTRRYVYTAMLPSIYWSTESVHQHPLAEGYVLAAMLAAQAFVGEAGRGLVQNAVVDPATGFVGFGTLVPTVPVHVMSVGTTTPAAFRADVDGGSAGSLWYSYAVNAGQGAFISSRKSRGSAATPSAALSGDTLMTVGGAGYGATAFPGGNSVSVDFLTSQDQSDTARGSTVAISTTSNNTTAKTQRLLIQHDGTTRPGADNAYTLGSSSFRWASIWAANGTVQTSDARDKDVVGDLVFAGAMVDAIDPVLFKWKVGGNIVQPSATETMLDEMGNVVPAMESVPRAGERVHAGFLAQSLKGAMDAASVDFGAWGVDDLADPDSRQWTRPDQLVAVLWAALKETRAELAKIKSALPSP